MRLLLPLLPLLLLGNSGCKREDVDILTRIGWKVTDKIQALVPEETPFGGTWGGLMGGLETRVKHRLQSDKFLAPVNLIVSAEGKTIRIQGQLKDPLLKRRAVEMVEATVGVDGIVDEIEVVE